MKNRFSILIIISSFFFLLNAQPEFVNYLADNRLNHIHDLEPEGRIIWIATENGVIKRNVKGKLLQIFTIEDGLADNNVTKIAIDSSHNKWFGTVNGVSKFDGKHWINYTEEDGLVSNNIHTLCIGPDGKKWFGTNYGVSCFNDTNWITYTESDGLADNYIKTIAIDSEGSKWFGTYGSGVSKLTDTTWTTYTKYDVLLDNYITEIVIEPDNNVLIISLSCDSITRYDGTHFTHIPFYDG